MAVLGKSGNFVLCRFPTRAGLHRLAKAIARAIHLEDVAPVGEPVRESYGHGLAVEDLAPIAQPQVSRDERTLARS
jgi:hypothetical protein